jgi:hypothetical protein
MTCSPLFVVLAFRYGGNENTFPIGAFSSRLIAETAAKEHRNFRGRKYAHRIYKFLPDNWDDDVGHAGNNRPCIEVNVSLERAERSDDTLQDLVGNSAEDAARAKWNAEADEYNQWDSLGQDEKDELIANSINHMTSE